jgi:hypothetical protein
MKLVYQKIVLPSCYSSNIASNKYKSQKIRQETSSSTAAMTAIAIFSIVHCKI